MKLQKFFSLIFIFSCILFFCACSVKFDETAAVEDTIPEFIFQDANMIRYENKKAKNEISARTIEQYKNTPETFAQDVSFKSYNDKGELDTEGQCGFLFADTKTEVYEMYDAIKLFSHSQKIKFSADSLKWDSHSEQMIGGKNDMVKVEKDNTVIYGSGFSASGVSKTFTFSGTVSGDIETK